MKKALITGVTGQDGSYLAEFLLEKGYDVYGMVRRRSTENTERIDHIKDKMTLVEGDLTDLHSLIEIVRNVQPDEVYNLGAMSYVPLSWKQPELTGDVTGLGVARMLMAIHKEKPDAKFYQAGSSEQWGKVQTMPQNEKTPFYPRSPYGCAKCYGHYITVCYRESYGIFACVGILANHESPRRGLEFVTRKITNHVAKLKLGLTDKPLELGNLEAKRDWGFSGDYVRAMFLMLQQPKPDDYVIATGETHSVREFVESAFEAAGYEVRWEGKELDEIGRVSINAPQGARVSSMEAVKINPKFYRPAEVDILVGDASKAKEKLGWKPKVTFKELVRLMVESDIAGLK